MRNVRALLRFLVAGLAAVTVANTAVPLADAALSNTGTVRTRTARDRDVRAPGSDAQDQPAGDAVTTGTERPELRTATSRTFEQPDGSFISEFFGGAIHYDPAGSESWAPIDLRFQNVADGSVLARVDQSPVRVSLAPADAAGGFLRLESGGHRLRFHLPPGVTGGTSAIPTLAGARADFGDFLPGAVDLRVFPRTDGVKSFLVLHEQPTVGSFTFVVDAPGLTLLPKADGSLAFRDADGTTVGRIPRPFLVDSSHHPRLGSGIYSEAVTLTVGQLGALPTITVTPNPVLLASATYPVYVDPTVTLFPNDAGIGHDTFASSKYPDTNFNTYQRPDSPYYNELWLGQDPTDSSNVNEVFLKFTELDTVIGEAHIDEALLRVYPYHQYYDAPTDTRTWIGRVTAHWNASDLKWRNRPTGDVALAAPDPAYADLVEGQLGAFKVTRTVQDWMNDTYANDGFVLHERGRDGTFWKRLIAREDNGPTSGRPRLRVEWHRPTATALASTGYNGWTGSRTLSWRYDDGDATTSVPQSHFDVQVATDSTFSSGSLVSGANLGRQAGSGTSWPIPSSVALATGATYYWRLMVKDGTGWSEWSAPATFIWDPNAPQFTSIAITGATSVSGSTYYAPADATLNTRIRGSEPAGESQIRLTYLRLAHATDDARAYHNWSVGGTDCSEYDTSTLVDIAACAESYNSSGVREVDFSVTGLGSDATFDVQRLFADYATNQTSWIFTGKRIIFDAEPPQGSISLPLPGTPVSGSVRIYGTASDHSFMKYELAYGVGTNPTVWSPIGVGANTSSVTDALLGTWDAAALPDGPYTIRLRVYDRIGRAPGYTETARSVTLDNTVTASITDPLPDAHIRRSYDIRGSATAASGFREYTLSYGSGCAPSTWFDIGTNPRTTAVANGVLGTWDSAALNGPYTVRLVVTKSGGVTHEQQICVTVDNTAAVATIAHPRGNLSVAGEVAVTGSATDALGFNGYVLEYGVGRSPSSWTTIATSTAPATTEGPLGAWRTAGLTGVHTLRLTATDLAGNEAAVATHVVYVHNSRRGDESYYTRVPFDMGGGYSMAVGVANGELTLGRSLFTIPSYGPPQSMTLRYSALSTEARQFGVGWTSNLTQHLTFDDGFVLWHRADGGTVPFGQVDGQWTPLAGHFERLSARGSELVVTLRNETRLVFEGAGPGRLMRVENRFGKSLTLVWRTASLTATDASGRSTVVTFDAFGRAIVVADSADRRWTFTYVGSALASVVDPESAVTAFRYDEATRLTAVVRTRTTQGMAVEHLTWSIAYDGDGRTITVTDPLGARASPPVSHTFSYGDRETVVDRVVQASADGTVHARSRYVYDHLGRVTAVNYGTSPDDPFRLTRTTVYDADSNVQAVTAPLDTQISATTRYSHDDRGNVLMEDAPLNSARRIVTLYEYNATNDLVSETRGAGTGVALRIECHYDEFGRLLRTVHNPAGDSGADRNVVTTYQYDDRDLLVLETGPNGRTDHYTYDAFGNMTATIANHQVGLPPTAERNVRRERRYSAAGEVTSEVDEVGRVTRYEYDKLGRRVMESRPGDASIPDVTTTTKFDELGNPVQVTDSWVPLGDVLEVRATTRYAYSALNTVTWKRSPGGNVVAVDRDHAGNVLATETRGPDGLVSIRTAFAYDILGRKTMERLGSRVFHREYNARGDEVLFVAGTGSAAVTTSRSYDYQGHVLSETVGDGAAAVRTEWTYDLLGRETSETVAPGTAVEARTEQEYDLLGRAVRETLAAGTTDAVTDLTAYNAVGDVVETNAAVTSSQAGVLTTTEYDMLERPTRVVANVVPGGSDPSMNRARTYYYDSSGVEVAVRDASGTSNRSVVNARGGVFKRIENCVDAATTDPAACDGDGASDPSTNVMHLSRYNGRGDVVETVDPRGMMTLYDYDPDGRLIRAVLDSGGTPLTTEYAYDSAGNETAVRDARGTVTRKLYDAGGLLVKVIQNCVDELPRTSSDWRTCQGTAAPDGTVNQVSSIEYDSAGRRIAEVSARGVVDRYGYDSAGRLSWRVENVQDAVGATANVRTDYYYDAAGRRSASRTQLSDHTRRVVVRFLYDRSGQLVQRIENCTDVGEQEPIDPARCSGSGTQDADTNVRTRYGHDAHGNITSVQTPDPSAPDGTLTTTVYVYDGANQLCRVVEAASVSVEEVTCTSDVAGSSGENVVTNYTYDRTGQLVAVTDARGHVTKLRYDELGRLTARHTPGSDETSPGPITYGYDAGGNMTSQTNRSDPTKETPTVVWTYDAVGRLTARRSESEAIAYTYQDNGGVRTVERTVGEPWSKIRTEYDALGRPTEVSVDDAVTTRYEYGVAHVARQDPSGSYRFALDEYGRPVTITGPSGPDNQLQLAYGPEGRPTRQVDPSGNATSYAYDDVGRMTAGVTSAASPGTVRATTTYRYNRAGKQVEHAVAAAGAGDTAGYTYDELGRLTSFVPSWSAAEAYDWQALPNRRSVTVGTSAPDVTTYDAANRPVAINGFQAYRHDLDGNVTADPRHRYEWDALGRLRSVSDPNGVLVSEYVYDALDRLITVREGGGDTFDIRYVGDTHSLATLTTPAAASLSVGNNLDGTPLFEWTTGQPGLHLYGRNRHGDILWTATPDGDIRDVRRYNAWGSFVPARTDRPTLGFQGSLFEPSSGLYWMSSRWYDPRTGRFLSEDRVFPDSRRPQDMQLYAYGAADPVNRWDPDGQYWRRVRAGETTLQEVSKHVYNGSTFGWRQIWNLNRNRIGYDRRISAGQCIWISKNDWADPIANECQPSPKKLTGQPPSWAEANALTGMATVQETIGNNPEAWWWPQFVWEDILLYSIYLTNRFLNPDDPDEPGYRDELEDNVRPYDEYARDQIRRRGGTRVTAGIPGPVRRSPLRVIEGNNYWPSEFNPNAAAVTIGHYVFARDTIEWGTRRGRSLLAHEFIHTLQYQGYGNFVLEYIKEEIRKHSNGSPRNKFEAIGYVWEGFMATYMRYGERPPWRYFKSL